MKAIFKSDKQKPTTTKNPYESGSVFSRITFSWLIELIQVANNKPWQQEFNYELASDEKIQRYKEGLGLVMKKKKRLVPSIVKFFFWKLLLLTFLSIFGSILQFTSTLITTKVFQELTKHKDIRKLENLSPLFFYLFLSGAVISVRNVLNTYFSFIANRLSQIIRATI